MKEKKPLGRPVGTTKPIEEKKGRIEFLIPNKVIDKFGRSAMKLEMQRLWKERYDEETGETID